MLDEAKNASEIAKNYTTAAKNFIEAMYAIFQPRGLDAVLLKGHESLISNFIGRKDVSEEDKHIFLSTYKRVTKEYKNCQKVVNLAASMMPEEATPQIIDSDWFDFFFDKVRLISDESAHRMWSSILAGETIAAGTFSRSFVHTLSVMSSKDAHDFCELASFCLCENKDETIVSPFVFISTNVKTYENSGITAKNLFTLQNLGLIQCDFNNEFVFEKKGVFRTGNKIVEVYGDADNEGKIRAGNVVLTANGQALYKIVGNEYKGYKENILNFIVQKLKSRNCRIYINKKEV